MMQVNPLDRPNPVVSWTKRVDGSGNGEFPDTSLL
jgi:hypothetical protein